MAVSLLAAAVPAGTDDGVERLRAEVSWLAADARLGRGPDTAALAEVGAWLEERFAEIGLVPAAPVAGGYRHLFDWQESALPAFNVVGRLPGRRPDLPPIVLGAHYDHLGLGGWSSLAPGSDEPHNGADDNASGVAALLGAARLLAAGPAPERDLQFAAFSAEEAGRLGSRAFHAALPRPPAAMINLDMVGRMRDRRLYATGLASHPAWTDLLAAACARRDLACGPAGDEAPGPSDEEPFLAAGVPTLRLTTGLHPDYHRPGDDAEKIDAAGAVAVARLVADLARSWPSAPASGPPDGPPPAGSP